MANPIMQMLARNNNANIPNISPQQIEMCKQLLNNKGMNAEQMVRMICKQRGIDVNSLLSQFK